MRGAVSRDGALAHVSCLAEQAKILVAAALAMRSSYASALFENPGATTDDLREAVTTLEDTEPTARRVLGGAHPDVVHRD